MDLVKVLSIVCVCIEIWHIISYNFLYKKIVCRVGQVYDWMKEYKNFMDSFNKFTDSVIAEKELKNAISLEDANCLLGVVKFAHKSLEQRTREKILRLCSFKELKITIACEILEFIYLVLICIICVNLPFDVSLCIFVLTLLFSKLQSWVQKNKSTSEAIKKAIYIMDSCTFIAIFLAILFS